MRGASNIIKLRLVRSTAWCRFAGPIARSPALGSKKTSGDQFTSRALSAPGPGALLGGRDDGPQAVVSTDPHCNLAASPVLQAGVPSKYLGRPAIMFLSGKSAPRRAVVVLPCPGAIVVGRLHGQLLPAFVVRQP